MGGRRSGNNGVAPTDGADATIEVRSSGVTTQREVHMYLYIKAVHSVDMKAQTFRLIYYHYLQWYPTKKEMDLYLAGRLDDIVAPRYVPSNCISLEKEEVESRGDIKGIHLIEDGGLDVWGTVCKLPDDRPLMAISRKYSCVISSPFSLQGFPFDTQSLSVYFESDQTTRVVRFLPTPIEGWNCVDTEIGTIASDPDYIVHPPAVEFSAFGDESSPFDDYYSNMIVTLKLERISTGFVFRSLFPSAVVSILTMSAFFVKDFQSADRLNLLVTLILATVALLYVISESLPPVPYLCMADRYVNATLVFITAVTCYMSMAMVLDDLSEETDTFIGLIFCGVWVAAQVVYIIFAIYYKIAGRSCINLTYSELLDKGLLPIPPDTVACLKPKILYEDYKKSQ